MNYDSISFYEIDYLDTDFESNDRFAEFDVDDEYYYTTMYQEFYVLANCKFQFVFYGGKTALDHIDFLDFIIYNTNDNRNYKYIYDNVMYCENYKEDDINIHSVLLSIKHNYVQNNSNIKYIEKIKHMNYWEDIKPEDFNNDDLYNLMSNYDLYKKLIIFTSNINNKNIKNKINV